MQAADFFSVSLRERSAGIMPFSGSFKAPGEAGGLE